MLCSLGTMSCVEVVFMSHSYHLIAFPMARFAGLQVGAPCCWFRPTSFLRDKTDKLQTVDQGSVNIDVAYSMATAFDLDFWLLLLLATVHEQWSLKIYLTGKHKVTHGKGVRFAHAASKKTTPRMLHEVAHVSNACRHKFFTAKV